MAENAKSDYHTEVADFLDQLYEGQKGYVYSPTKNPSSGYWQEYYFKWPNQKAALVTHILSSTDRADVYITPSILKAPNNKSSAWRGTNYVWVEFDGNAPLELPAGVPKPTVRIQSSTKGHEHWYWRLTEFNSDKAVVEGLTKSLTYTLDADRSGWDAVQVLRPPGTLHHDSGRRTRILKADSSTVSLTDFKDLVIPPEPAVQGLIDDIPSVDEAIAKYKWDSDDWALFQQPKLEVGTRSSALTRIGFACIEMGMSNEETYSVLYNADERWGKFKDRPPKDRAKRLIGIINYCRGKKELQAELALTEREAFVSLGDFLNTEIKIKWIYKDFLAEQGLGIISSAPGVGKTTFSLRMGMAAVLGRDFLRWSFGASAGKKIGFLSLEMSGEEIKSFMVNMLSTYTEPERDLLKKNFTLLPLGYSLMLYEKNNQQMLLDAIDQHEIDILIVDSLKAATGLKEQKTDDFFNWVNKSVRHERKCAVWIIHHNRKPTQEGPKKPQGLEDLYGDMFIGAHPSTVVALWKKNLHQREVLPLKIRMARETEGFVTRLTDNQDFIVEEGEELSDEETKQKSDFNNPPRGLSPGASSKF